jgi:hypothetical protein
MAQHWRDHLHPLRKLGPNGLDGLRFHRDGVLPESDIQLLLDE